MLRQRPPKSYKLLNFFMISVILFKLNKHSDFHLIFFQIEGAWQDFTVVTKLIKIFKSLYGFGGRFLKIRDVCMDFDPCFKVHNLASVHPKSIILGQMTNLNMIFHLVVSIYRLAKIWNSPQFPDEFRNGLLSIITHPLIFEWFYWLLYVTWYKFSGQLSRNNPRPSRYLSSDCFRRGET